MTKVSVEALQHEWAKYLKLVESGETLVLTRENHVVAEVKPLTSAARVRPFGLCAGEFVAPDDFDEPLPAEVLAAFEGR